MENPKIIENTRQLSHSFIDRYIDLLVDHKRILFAISWVLILIAGYLGSAAFSDLRDGGFSPPQCESALGMSLMNKYLNYPEYPITIQVQSMTPQTLNASTAQFEAYYRQIQQNLVKYAPVGGVIGYYDYPYQTRMISSGQDKVLLYAGIRGKISNDGLQKLVSITPLRAYVGGGYAFGNELNDEILAGVETAEFGSLPIIFVLLIIALGGLVAGILPFYVAMMGIFWTLSFLLAFNDAFRISSISASIVTMFGLGLAIDYSLFIVSRFKLLRQRYPEAEVKPLLKETFLTAGKTVLISALTVFVALIGGLFFQEFFLTSICFAVMLSAGLSAVAANSFLFCVLAWCDHSIQSYSVPHGVYQLPRLCLAALFPTYIKTPSVMTSSALEEGKAHVDVRKVSNRADPGREEEREEAEQRGEGMEGEEKKYDLEGGGGVVAITPSSINPADLEEGGKKDYQRIGHDESPANAAATLMLEVSEEEKNGFWFALSAWVLAHPWLVTISSFSFLISLSIYFLVVAQYGNTDADVLPIASQVRAVYDDFRQSYPLYGSSNHYIFLQTSSSSSSSSSRYSVSSPVFLQALRDFQVGAVEAIGPQYVSNLYSMIDIGEVDLTFSDYLQMYANPSSSSLYQNYTRALVYPLSLTNLHNATYLQISTTCHQYDQKCKEIVRTLRSLLKRSPSSSSSSPAYFYDPVTGEDMLSERLVTGEPAMTLDLYESLDSNIPVWISIQMIAIFLILMFMTRSLLLPLKAVLLSILSLGATFGLIQLLFQSTYPQTNHALGFVPTGYFAGSYIIFIFSVAFGLSVDYEVFLLSRILENYAISGQQEQYLDLSVNRALEQSGGIITSAAIMLGVTTFAFIGCQVYFIKVIGVGITIAVVLDATIIRMLLVPAMIKLFGKYNFFVPDWLGRVIDRVGLYEIDPKHLLTSR